MYPAKTDIQSAFRIITVSPNDYPYLVLIRRVAVSDRVLAMGCSSSCAIFEKFRTRRESSETREELSCSLSWATRSIRTHWKLSSVRTKLRNVGV